MRRGSKLKHGFLCWGISAAIFGCSFASQTEHPRGVPIQPTALPSPVLDRLPNLERDHSTTVRSIESCDEGAFFRIELKSGSIMYFDADGEWRGTVI